MVYLDARHFLACNVFLFSTNMILYVTDRSTKTTLICNYNYSKAKCK